jgi:hypothetical protein
VRARPGTRLRAVLANASLRVRVMAVAAILVTVTSVVMGSLGTALLRGYLISRADQQLSSFAALASHRLAGSGSRFQPPRPPGPSGLPLQFLVEVIGAGGKVQVAGRPQHDMAPPKITATRRARSPRPRPAIQRVRGGYSSRRCPAGAVSSSPSAWPT